MLTQLITPITQLAYKTPLTNRMWQNYHQQTTTVISITERAADILNTQW